MKQDTKPASLAPAVYNRAQGMVPDGLAWSLGDDTDGLMTADDLTAARARIAARKAARALAETQGPL